jgi:hypothetical protein
MWKGCLPKHAQSKETEAHPNTDLRKNMTVEYKPVGSQQWVKASLVSRSGKSTGKYKNEWNVMSDRMLHPLNFDVDVTQWREVGNNDQGEDIPNEVQITEIFQAETLQNTIEAKLNELESWKSNSVYEEVPDVGQPCISVRWVIRPKVIDGKLQTKARLCARGFEETCEFRTDSPTCMRESVRAALCIIVTKSWVLHSIDYKTAFLQGNPIERELFVRPPKESNTCKIWKLNKTVYGLADAPRVWYLRLKEELLKLGATVSTYDQGVFFWHSSSGLEGVLICFVDDQLWGGTDQFEHCIIQKLRSTFHINYEHSSAFKYIGIYLLQSSDRTINISQTSYLKSVEPVPVDRQRQLQKDDHLTEDEKRQFHQING